MGNAAAAGIGRCGVVVSMKTHDHLPVGHLHESRHGIPPGIPVLLSADRLAPTTVPISRNGFRTSTARSRPYLSDRGRLHFRRLRSERLPRPTGSRSLASARGLPHEARSNVRAIRRGIRRALGSIRPREPNGASPNRDRKHAFLISRRRSHYRSSWEPRRVGFDTFNRRE